MKFIITTFDGDMYVLQGYASSDEIRERLGGLKYAKMPNGDEIAISSIAKIQSIESYKFQADQKSRHKRGQRMGGRELEKWIDTVNKDDIGPSNVASIEGVVRNMPAIGGLGIAGKK